jgi:hypothetical protein
MRADACKEYCASWALINVWLRICPNVLARSIGEVWYVTAGSLDSFEMKTT